MELSLIFGVEESALETRVRAKFLPTIAAFLGNGLPSSMRRICWVTVATDDILHSKSIAHVGVLSASEMFVVAESAREGGIAAGED